MRRPVATARGSSRSPLSSPICSARPARAVIRSWRSASSCHAAAGSVPPSAATSEASGPAPAVRDPADRGGSAPANSRGSTTTASQWTPVEPVTRAVRARASAAGESPPASPSQARRVPSRPSSPTGGRRPGVADAARAAVARRDHTGSPAPCRVPSSNRAERTEAPAGRTGVSGKATWREPPKRADGRSSAARSPAIRVCASSRSGPEARRPSRSGRPGSRSTPASRASTQVRWIHGTRPGLTTRARAATAAGRAAAELATITSSVGASAAGIRSSAVRSSTTAPAA
jgi:hypothetical protein